MKTIAEQLNHDFKQGSLYLYDSNGKEIPSCDGKIVEIEGKTYKLIELD
jgi:hypothetical protein